jgi:hypothetical protein
VEEKDDEIGSERERQRQREREREDLDDGKQQRTKVFLIPRRREARQDHFTKHAATEHSTIDKDQLESERE